MEATKAFHMKNQTISDAEIKKVVYFPSMKPEIADEICLDVKNAIDLVIKHQDARTTALMKRMHIGFNYAAKIMDYLDELGVIGYQIGKNKRDILIKK